MTRSWTLALVLGALAGPGLAQPAPNPPTGPQLAVQPPRLESILGTNGGCSTNGPIFADAPGYNGSADVFEGPTALVLTGTRLSALSDIQIVLPNGTRQAALTRSECPGANVRVTFVLPVGARAVRLELLAPEAAPLASSVKPPVQTCLDRTTGQPAACPDLPRATPRKIGVAEVTLNLIPRPRINSVAPGRIGGNRTGLCRGGVVFFGSNLARVRILDNLTGTARPTITSQTQASLNAVLTRACDPGSSQPVFIQPSVLIRRGRGGGMAEIIRCDTCSDGVPTTFGGATVVFSGD